MKTARIRKPGYPAFFLLWTLALVLLGCIFVLEASSAESLTTFGDQFFLFKKQVVGAALGIGVFILAALIPPKLIIKYGHLLYIGALSGLVAVLIPGVGMKLNGAQRWLSLGGIVIQPVELMKLGIIAYLTQWLGTHQKLKSFIATLFFPVVCVMLQPDLGSVLLLLGMSLSLYFAAGGKLKQLFQLAGVGIPILLILILISPYRRERLQTFLNPESDPLGASFHMRQITLALGRGGWFGQGLGNSSQKFAYIPEASTDSIFAIIAEEVGFVGSLTIIGLLVGYCAFAYAQTAHRLKDPQLQLLAIGICSWLLVQILLNLASVTGLVPLTGVPLPFFSYGRSSLIMILCAAGILYRLSKES
ncbi:cell division protein FtsW [Candidatus Woesebacteria bacterium]|nr:cell division protein FtsW [Candidatus Woesebacteria bacterium]